ncbi:MAG TPA: glycosyltransferase family 39 protein [Anaerolineales bacterium]|nr:glycosyltransferase family 39 protein [Anaerolineales bacterium]
MSLRLRTSQIKNEITALASKPWMQYVWLAVITLFAAALRFYKLGEWSFWIDEIYTINHAMAHFSTPQLTLDHIPPARNWIPISVILSAQVFNVWMVSEFNARLVAAIFGIITIPALYFPIKNIFNTRVALITVLLLAVSSWHLEWSQNARGYTSLLLFSWLAVFTFYFGLEKDRASYFVWFFIFLYLAASERLIALFILPALVLYLLAVKFLPMEKPIGLRARNIYILLTPVLLFGIYEIYSLIRNDESVIGAILAEIVSTFFGKPIESPFTQTIFQVFKLGVPLFALSLLSGIYIWRQRTRAGWLFVLNAVVPFFLVIFVTPFMFTEERYALVSLPAWLALAAIGIDKLLVRVKNYEPILAFGLLLVLLADSLGASLLYYRVNHGNRWDYQSAFAIVQANLQEGDRVVSTFSEMGNYYLKRDDVVRWDDINKETIESSGRRVWFVIIPDMTWYTGTEDFYWWVSHYTRLIRTLYIRTVDNTNLEIYLYDPAASPQLERLKDPD